MTVVKWRTLAPVTHLAGGWSKPAISWPFLVAILEQRQPQAGDQHRPAHQEAPVPRRDRHRRRPRAPVDRPLARRSGTRPARTSSRILIANVQTGRVSTVRLVAAAARVEPLAARWRPGLDRAEPRHLASPRAHVARGHRIRTRLRIATPRLFWTTAIVREWRIRHAMEHEQQPGVHPARRSMTIDEVIRGPPHAEGFPARADRRRRDRRAARPRGLRAEPPHDGALAVHRDRPGDDRAPRGRDRRRQADAVAARRSW